VGFFVGKNTVERLCFNRNLRHKEENMKVLVLGSGGREHAIAWKIAQSPLLTRLFVAPGNPGTASFATNLTCSLSNFNAIGEQVLHHGIDLVVVGPEVPLVEGLADYFYTTPSLQHVKFVGPDKYAAQLEGSKDFAKQFMQRHGIPTARYATFTNDTLNDGIRYLESLHAPYVLKADGLAAGKGVLILSTLPEAINALQSLLGGQFGSSSTRVVIEEFLSGIELSVFALTDGKDYVLLPEAKDYKRIGEGDTGLNTGGMGAVSPVSFADEAFMSKVISRVVEPTMQGIRSEGMKYTGFVFFGLINVQGDPYVIEYNCRMGDPETEVVMPRIASDLLPLLMAAGSGSLEGMTLEMDQRAASTVMLVAGGYPEDYEKGNAIEGLNNVQDSIVFHAGTKLEGEKIVTNGGRVLAITSYGENIHAALETSYANALRIHWKDKYYRSDLGRDLR
jgi:phosphoribosylamine--glycine ligase